MHIGQAANRMLSLLEQTDQEEYNRPKAIEHLNQAIAEITDESELSIYNQFATFTMDSARHLDTDAWSIVPGRVPITDVLSADASRIAYIKQCWLSVNSNAAEFKQAEVRKMLSDFGDDEGTPTRYGVDGEFFYFRPVPPADTEYVVRSYFAGIPPEYGGGDEPLLMAQAPHAVIYRACVIACVWTMDDDRAIRFDKMAQRLIDRYVVRDGMKGDGERVEMEDYNG